MGPFQPWHKVRRWLWKTLWFWLPGNLNYQWSLDLQIAPRARSGYEYSEAQFAIFKIGGCPINVNYRYKADELVYLLDNADARRDADHHPEAPRRVALTDGVGEEGDVFEAEIR